MRVIMARPPSAGVLDHGENAPSAQMQHTSSLMVNGLNPVPSNASTTRAMHPRVVVGLHSTETGVAMFV